MNRACDICGKICKCISTNGMHLCNKHYKQFKKYGKFLDNNPRTIYDKNQYYIHGIYTYIDIYNNKCEIIAQTIIDTEDLNKVKDIKWKLSASGYAINTSRHGTIHMTHVITGAKNNEYVDHINHNVLDNRKFNLRIVTKSQNQMNSYNKGVTITSDNKYYAYIKILQKMINLGKYDREQDALWARWYAEFILFGKYRYYKPEPILSYERKIQIKQYVDNKIQNCINNNNKILDIINNNRLEVIVYGRNMNSVI